MSGKEILVDTNILLYLLAGNDTLEAILQHKNIYISFITELELIGYKNIDDKYEGQIQALLNDCTIIPLNDQIKKEYIKIRKTHPLKLADAIIAATSIAFGIPLITSDKQFKKVTKLKLIAYEF